MGSSGKVARSAPVARSLVTLPWHTPWHAPVARSRGTLPWHAPPARARLQAPRVTEPEILVENTFTNGLRLKS